MKKQSEVGILSPQSQEPCSRVPPLTSGTRLVLKMGHHSAQTV